MRHSLSMLTHLPLVPYIYVSALVQVMAYRLFGEPMLPYCQLDFWEQISAKFESEFYHFDIFKSVFLNANVRISIKI